MSSKPPARRRGAAVDADGVAVDAPSVAVGEERIRQPLLTRLMPPVMRSEFVVRERLHRRIREGVDRGPTLVAAAPGFGKSTLLAAWHSDLIVELPLRQVPRVCAVCFTASHGLVVAGIAARAWYVNRFGSADDSEPPVAGLLPPPAEDEPRDLELPDLSHPAGADTGGVAAMRVSLPPT